MGMGRYSDNVIFFVSQGGLRAACFLCEKSRQRTLCKTSFCLLFGCAAVLRSLWAGN